ncbi:TetR/AcrR family transcriptional regulator [Paenibacillus paeoniae]|uniref:TetR/AcrR family transcriptional regulator n=1 Tax=Paenibacillus paeoniae TaxID=2292705 RepID=A0A371PMZ9_9BACL|nr:TetR/AcrR family transcriptional regulator [Paenibacillus paeoniae]REK77584.1 TetR/AcrR family transcriptional regulator [Paenibacillus paeoniae]
MNKKKLQSEQTKKKVAEAARALFAQKGYKATSIEDIVAATGSSKGNIYYHFQSKEGLFQYLLNEWDNEWKEQWSELERDYATVSDKLQGLAEHLVVNDLNHPLTRATDEFLTSEWERSDVQDDLSSHMNQHVEFNKQLLQQAMDKGELAQGDAATMAYVLEALFMGLAEVSKRMPDREATIDIYRNAMNVFLNGTTVGSSEKR